MSQPDHDKLTEAVSVAVQELKLGFNAALADSVSPGYATNLAVQRTEYEYILSFFEVLPPLLIGTPDAVMRQINGMEHAPTHCVARVIIARARIKEFADLLQRAVAEDSSLSSMEQ